MLLDAAMQPKASYSPAAAPLPRHRSLLQLWGSKRPPRPLPPRRGPSIEKGKKEGPGSTSTGSSQRKKEFTIVYFDCVLPAK